MKKLKLAGLLLLSGASFYIAAALYGTPLPTDPTARREELRKRIAETPHPKGYVFQPSRTYENDISSLVTQNMFVYNVAQELANITGKEVFVSYGAQDWPVPDIKIEDSRRAVAQELIRKIESIKEADITVIELGNSTLAIIRRSFDPINRQK